MIIDGLASIDIYPLESGIGILRIVQVSSQIYFPVSERRGIFYLELGLLFHERNFNDRFSALLSSLFRYLVFAVIQIMWLITTDCTWVRHNDGIPLHSVEGFLMNFR